jgi:hypothetical protein
MVTKVDPLSLTQKSQESLLSFVQKILEAYKANNQELVNKMDAIDQAYARYKETLVESSGGVDTRAAQTVCDIFDKDHVTPPLVVAQVDSFVGYLAEVFLSGYPIFPVVSTPATKKYAEQLETLLDDHSQIGGYARQLLMFLRDACKYNYAAVEVDWDIVNQFGTLQDFMTAERRLERKDKYFNRLNRLNPRNLIRDPSVLPGDVSEHGDYAGYVERITMTQLKRLILRLQKEGRAMNVTDAMASNISVSNLNPSNGQQLFNENPVISNYVIGSGREKTPDWDAYFDGKTPGNQRRSYGAMYEKVIIYARIMPADHGIRAVQPRTPQIWKIITINGKLLSAFRIVSAYDYLPILIGQPIEDGFAEQTQSIGESQIPFQEASETLFGIRFAAARRAVSDRALYNSNVLSSAQVNSRAAAPKIPVNIPAMGGVSLESIYKQIPFDLRGTETALQDAQVIAGFGQQLSGINGPQQGQFQRGNKSVTEWTDTMGNSDSRLRLPALTLEHQVFARMKSVMTLNIMQYGDDVELVSQKSGEVVKVNIEDLRTHAMTFRVADGYTPKSKLAGADFILQGIQQIGQSPILQEAYGPYLPGMFAHLMQLGGVRGLEEYDPMHAQKLEGQAAQADPMQNLNAAALQLQQQQALMDPSMDPAADPTQQQQLPGSLP